MDKLDWYKVLNKAIAGDEISIKYVKEHQLEMKHHMENKSSKVEKSKVEEPKQEKKTTKKKIVKNED